MTTLNLHEVASIKPNRYFEGHGITLNVAPGRSVHHVAAALHDMGLKEVKITVGSLSLIVLGMILNLLNFFQESAKSSPINLIMQVLL